MTWPASSNATSSSASRVSVFAAARRSSALYDSSSRSKDATRLPASKIEYVITIMVSAPTGGYLRTGTTSTTHDASSSGMPQTDQWPRLPVSARQIP